MKLIVEIKGETVVDSVCDIRQHIETIQEAIDNLRCIGPFSGSIVVSGEINESFKL